MALIQWAVLATIIVRKIKDITIAVNYCSHHHQTLLLYLGLLNKDAEKDTFIRVYRLIMPLFMQYIMPVTTWLNMDFKQLIASDTDC